MEWFAAELTRMGARPVTGAGTPRIRSWTSTPVNISVCVEISATAGLGTTSMENTIGATAFGMLGDLDEGKVPDADIAENGSHCGRNARARP